MINPTIYTDASFPPGSVVENINCQQGTNNKSIPKVIFIEHRYAFFWWNHLVREKRKQDSSYSVDLITIDYHQDLAEPNEHEKADLENLILNSDKEVALFTWKKIHIKNDSHILSAAYRNIIGSVYVLTKSIIIDDKINYLDNKAGQHSIYVCDNYNEFESKIKKQIKSKNIILDIDVDYFIKKEGLQFQKDSWELMNESEFNRFVDDLNKLLGPLIQKIDLVTIALEPDYNGGFANSIYNYTRLDERLLK